MTEGLQPIRPDGGLSVRGGVGGIRFQWEELEEASRVLTLLAADAGEVVVALATIDRDVSELPWRVLHLQAMGGTAWPFYRDAVSDVEAACVSARDNWQELDDTDDRLRRGLRAYRAADAAALAATEALRAVTAEAGRVAARSAAAVGAVQVGPLRLLHNGSDGPVPFDGSVEGIVDRLVAVDSGTPGTFEVLVAGTADRPVYVVVLPGTQTGTVDGRPGSNPFDVGGIAEALTEDSRYTEVAVREALEDAGAQKGDPLVIAGYSQGGLHAVNVAGPQGLGSDYDVELVVTVGSPTGWDAPGAGEYLHLEHGLDAVPHLDASANSDGRHRTTVILGHAVPPLTTGADGTREHWGLGPAHKLGNYAEGARLVDASAAPSLAPAVAVLAVAGASGSARRHSFTAVRATEHSAVLPAAPGRAPAAGARSRLWP